MALNEVNPIQSTGHQGGGLFGSIVGGAGGLGLGALGGILATALSGPAAPATAGALLGSALGGAATGGGLGSQLGGIIGEQVDPSKDSEVTQAVPLTAPQNSSPAPTLNVMNSVPEVKMAVMQNSKNLLRTSDLPVANDYITMIDQAMNKQKQQLNGMSSIYGG